MPFHALHWGGRARRQSRMAANTSEKASLPYDPLKDIAKAHCLEPLSEQEMVDFFRDIDADDDGVITFEELQRKLGDVYDELEPDEAKPHHLHHPKRRFGSLAHDEETAHGLDEYDGPVAFLRALMPGCKERLTRDDFFERVREWNVPSQEQTTSEQADSKDAEYENRLTWRRRLRARWSVQGPKISFITIVVALQVAFGLWQGIIYVQNRELRRAVGWGVILAKFSAGALYPTMFFMVLSMSRWNANFMRRFYYVSLFVNWDRSQSFHIWMACAGLVLATLHAIGHMTGTFLYGSRPAHLAELRAYLGPGAPQSYLDFVRSLPGWSGIVSLGLYWLIALLSMPRVRTRCYELFQLTHLLMFPMLALLCAHGANRLLGYPMLGFWLAIPLLLTVKERLVRFVRCFIAIPARMQVLDDQTVTFTCEHAKGRYWRYQAGQYVFLQVPSISFFQWHPFTVSASRGDEIQLHIKTDGNWTRRLRQLPTDRDIRIGLDGPFGAPAQRFYDFDHALIIGAGVGVTPFSAILTDLEQNLSDRHDPWHSARRSSMSGAASVKSQADMSRETTHSADAPGVLDADVDEAPSPILVAPAPARAPAPLPRSTASSVNFELSRHPNADKPTSKSRRASTAAALTPVSRRVDFHWLVRERNHLLWFSTLLNRAHALSLRMEKQQTATSGLTLNITPHITARRKNISTHVFRYLLDSYRTKAHPYSALTGLSMRSSFGRPDLAQVLQDFHRDMVRDGYGAVRNGSDAGTGQRQSVSAHGRRVGVFFCGHPAVGSILADACKELTAQSRADGSRIRYIFLMEVFG